MRGLRWNYWLGWPCSTGTPAMPSRRSACMIQRVVSLLLAAATMHGMSCPLVAMLARVPQAGDIM